jgi:putative DNA primase/helicase
MSPPDDKVVGLAQEKARRLKLEVERLARLPTVEWMFYVSAPGYAEKYGTDKATLKQIVEAVIRGVEKKQRNEITEQRRREQRVEKQREREAREAKREAERKEKEKRKAFATIIRLPSSEHEGRLQVLAKQLGEDVEILRYESMELLAEEEERIRRSEIEPWHEPVETRVLLNELEAQFGKYIIIRDRVIAPIIPLWICFAWVHDIATYSPVLVIQGGDAETAKTTASKMVGLLTPRAHVIVEPTGPSLYRFVDRIHPTLIIDDADRLLPRRPDLTHIINASWTRNTPIPRYDSSGAVYLYDPFCPKVLNGVDLLAHLAPATSTRCVTIQLLPKLEGEEVIDFRYAPRDEKFTVLRRKLQRWAADNMAALSSAKPAMPKGFISRLENNYHLLFAVADLAGGDWPKRARAAAVKLSHEHSEPSLGKRLLAIFFNLFIAHGALLTSKEVEQLVPTEGDEFANYRNHGRAINKYEIAQLLKPYGIKPGLIHPRGKKTADRGYNAAWFETAFKHFLRKSLPEGRSVVRKQS